MVCGHKINTRQDTRGVLSMAGLSDVEMDAEFMDAESAARAAGD
jgi:hypothetical protein